MQGLKNHIIDLKCNTIMTKIHFAIPNLSSPMLLRLTDFEVVCVTLDLEKK